MTPADDDDGADPAGPGAEAPHPAPEVGPDDPTSTAGAASSGDPAPPRDPAPTDGEDEGQDEGGGARPVPRLLVVAAVVVALLVVGLGATALWRLARADDGPPGLAGAEAADAFVAAYARHLDATFLVEGELTRTLSDGRSLSSAYLQVQRPPDHLQRALGSTSGVVDGRTVNCSTPDGGSYTCAATGPAVDPAEERRTTLDALDSYVRGEDPVYAVTGDGEGCFDLLRRRTVLEATYGRRAQVCFDPATNAIRRLEVEREGGATDVLLAELVRGTATDADFDLEQDDTYDPDLPDAADAGGPPVPTTP